MIPRFKPDLDFTDLKILFKNNKGSVSKFEKNFAEKFDAVDAVAFPYGRSAQWAFFKAIGIKNAEIIMPAYTCSVVAHAITLGENIPHFIDINHDDFNMNLEKTEQSINEKTRAIIATHTFGYPQNLDKLEDIVKNGEKKYGNKIWLMQDCCHAFGAKWNERKIGTSGDVAVYAFNISKLMTSIFGGMLTFQNQDLANEIRTFRDNNYKPESFLKNIKRRVYFLFSYIAFNEKFYGLTWWLQNKTPILDTLTKSYHLDEKIHFPPDYLDQMLNFEAAVGMEQLKKYDEIIAKRTRIVKKYNDYLKNKNKLILPPILKGATYSHYPIRVNSKKSVLEKLANAGVEVGELIQYVIPEMNCYKENHDKNKEDFLIAKKASETTINIPIHTELNKKQLLLFTE